MLNYCICDNYEWLYGCGFVVDLWNAMKRSSGILWIRWGIKHMPFGNELRYYWYAGLAEDFRAICDEIKESEFPSANKRWRGCWRWSPFWCPRMLVLSRRFGMFGCPLGDRPDSLLTESRNTNYHRLNVDSDWPWNFRRNIIYVGNFLFFTKKKCSSYLFELNPLTPSSLWK